MDGRKCLVTGGPDKGDAEEPGLIFASLDRGAIDVEALRVMKGYNAVNRLDMDIWEFPQIKRAVELVGIGTGSDDDIELVEVSPTLWDINHDRIISTSELAVMLEKWDPRDNNSTLTLLEALSRWEPSS